MLAIQVIQANSLNFKEACSIGDLKEKYAALTGIPPNRHLWWRFEACADQGLGPLTMIEEDVELIKPSVGPSETASKGSEQYRALYFFFMVRVQICSHKLQSHTACFQAGGSRPTYDWHEGVVSGNWQI